MDEPVIVRMLKLMSGPDGTRHPKKFYPVSAAEAKMLVAAGAAEVVPVPAKARVESATLTAPENADRRPRPVPVSGRVVGSGSVGTVVVETPTETADERHARYEREAREAGISEDLVVGEVQDRELFDMLVAEGADRAQAATEVWGESPPSHPWIPQPAPKPTGGDRIGAKAATSRKSR